jgi:hypothetical protein
MGSGGSRSEAGEASARETESPRLARGSRMGHVMPQVGSHAGARIYMHYECHREPHVHVFHPDGNAG